MAIVQKLNLPSPQFTENRFGAIFHLLHVGDEIGSTSDPFQQSRELNIGPLQLNLVIGVMIDRVFRNKDKIKKNCLRIQNNWFKQLFEGMNENPRKLNE